MATEHGKGQLSENSSETSHPSYARGINASSVENYQCEKSFSHEKHLQEINRKVVVSVGDGNCLFRSISKGLLGTESYHALARKAVTDTMVNNPKIFNSLHADITSSRGCPYAELFPPRALNLRVVRRRKKTLCFW